MKLTTVTLVSRKFTGALCITFPFIFCIVPFSLIEGRGLKKLQRFGKLTIGGSSTWMRSGAGISPSDLATAIVHCDLQTHIVKRYTTTVLALMLSDTLRAPEWQHFLLRNRRELIYIQSFTVVAQLLKITQTIST